MTDTKLKTTLLIILLLVVIITTAILTTPDKMPFDPVPVDTGIPEYKVQTIALSGPLADRNAEVSGMDWYLNADMLILLPQYPNWDNYGGDGRLFAISRDQLAAYLNGDSTAPITPLEIPLVAPGLIENIPGFEGYEAIAFFGDQVFVTVEAETDKAVGYLLAGKIAPDLSEIRLDTTHITTIQTPVDLPNKAYEALLVTGDGNPVTFYEVNSATYNPGAEAYLFDRNLDSSGSLPIDSMEYRLTDVTALGANNTFWAINYNFPGDTDIVVDTDPLAEQYGEGTTHACTLTVERLVEFQYSEEGITMTGTPPIQLELIDCETARNWEGITRLGEGFLIVTDKFPETILGYVEVP